MIITKQVKSRISFKQVKETRLSFKENNKACLFQCNIVIFNNLLDTEL